MRKTQNAGKSNKKQQESKKGRPSSAGRRKGKFELFFGRTEERKLRHVLKNNGARAAKAYVSDGGSSAILRKIAQEGTFAGSVAREALGR